MIHPDAVREFLEGHRDNHGWIKKIPEADLDAELERLKFRVAHKAKPLRKHQKACALLGLAFPQFSFWLDMGTGKTRLVLELLRHQFNRGKIKRVLILCPSEASVNGWVKQIRIWRIGLPYLALGNSPTAEKWELLDEFEEGLIIATYPGLVWMLAKKVTDEKGRTKMKRHQRSVRRLTDNLQAVIFDESTKLGNQGSLWYRLCRKIAQSCDIRYALAGRPFGKDPTMIWSQQFLIDQGASLGPTLGLFRAAFFHEKRGYFGGFDYKFDKRMEPDLAEMMAHRSISYAESECQSLPKVTRIREEINLPEDAKAYYEKAVQAIRLAQGDRAKIRNLFLRMRQLSSGFLGYTDDETGEKAQLTFLANPKLDHLIELIQSVPLDRKGVIFHDFTYSGKIIDQALTKLKIQHGWLWGGTKNSKEVQDRFDDDPKMRFLIVNSKLGSMALNLQVANYCFYFESPISVIDREQSEKRCFREGQTRKGFIIDLVAKGTMDQRILDFHKQGEDVMKALLRGDFNA